MLTNVEVFKLPILMMGENICKIAHTPAIAIFLSHHAAASWHCRRWHHLVMRDRFGFDDDSGAARPSAAASSSAAAAPPPRVRAACCDAQALCAAQAAPPPPPLSLLSPSSLFRVAWRAMQ